jgi:hypothetical protein
MSIELLLFEVLIAGLPALVFLGFFALYMEYRRKPVQRGFEVKLTTGQGPVSREKER